MFSFFKKTKVTQELDTLIAEIKMAMENNYKDIAKLKAVKQNDKKVKFRVDVHEI